MNNQELEAVYNDRNLVGYTNFRMMIDRLGGFEQYMQAGPPAAWDDHDDIINRIRGQINESNYKVTPQQLGTILLAYRQDHDALLADFNEAAREGINEWMNVVRRINRINHMNTTGGKTRSFYKSRRAHRKHKKSNRSCSKKNRTRRSYLKNKKSNKK